MYLDLRIFLLENNTKTLKKKIFALHNLREHLTIWAFHLQISLSFRLWKTTGISLILHLSALFLIP